MQELNSNNKGSKVSRPAGSVSGTGNVQRQAAKPQGAKPQQARTQATVQNGPQKGARGANANAGRKASDIPRPPKPHKAPKQVNDTVSISKNTIILIACIIGAVILIGIGVLVFALTRGEKTEVTEATEPVITTEVTAEPIVSDNEVVAPVEEETTSTIDMESEPATTSIVPEATQELLGDAKFIINNKYIEAVQREDKDSGASVIIPIGTDKVDGKSKYTIEIVYTAGVISLEDINKYSAYVITKKLDEMVFDPALCSIKSDILALETANGTEIRFKGTKFKDKEGEKATVFTNILTYSGDVYSVAFTIKSPDGTESSSQSYTDSLAELKSVINSFACNTDAIQQVDYSEANKPEPTEEVEIDTKVVEPDVEYQDMITVEKDGMFLITSNGEGALYKAETEPEVFTIAEVQYSNAYSDFVAGTKVYAYNCKIQSVDEVKTVEPSDHYFLLAGKHLKAGKHTITGLAKGGYVCVYDNTYAMNSKTSVQAEETEEINIKEGYIAEIVNCSIK